MTKPAQWKKLVVGMREVNPADLLANPKNWRIHPSAQREALRGSIHELGYGDPVEVQEGTDMVLDGHLRVALAIQEEQETITVLDLRFETDAEADQYLLTKDPIAAMANADRDQLTALLEDVSTGEAAVQTMLADMAEREGLTPREPFDAVAEWQGMPEYENDDLRPIKQVVVSFATEDAVREFARLVGGAISPGGSTSIWFPLREKRDFGNLTYLSDDDSDDA